MTVEAIRRVPELQEDSGWQMTVPGFTRCPVVYRHIRSRRCGWARLLFRTPDNGGALLVEDFRRALREKRSRLERYAREGIHTWLVLEAPEIGWPKDFLQAFNEAIKGESLEAFEDIYLACALDVPAHFVLLKVGAVLGAPQPLYSEFVTLWDSRRRKVFGDDSDPAYDELLERRRHKREQEAIAEPPAD